MTKRIGVAAVFLVGCAVGGVSSQLVVPQATAQQAATLTKWQMFCDVYQSGSVAADVAQHGNTLGAQGWEPVGGGAQGVWCWKRPKL